MLYRSTRGSSPAVDSAEAVLSGIAPDGGLYLPEALPAFDWQGCLQKDTVSMAASLLGALLPGIPDMDALTKRAYLGKFQSDDLTPTVTVGDFTVLELFRGPTSAFKDVALSMLPQLLTAAKGECGAREDIMILTATSGDTGKAALEGFHDVPGVRICVFYPDGGVSQVQRAQMVTQEGENVAVCAVKGNFDDAQTGVKNIFTQCRGRELPFRLSSANSINIGRLAPQIMYYFRAYRDLLDAGKIQLGDEVNFCVPTGNFGDILAGYLAKLLGLPVGKLICASNANNVLTDFIRTGIYDRNRPFYTTQSPSMDILVSSNLERLLFDLSGENDEEVRGYMAALSKDGKYEVSDTIKAAVKEQYWGGFCDEDDTAATIAEYYKEKGYLIDTHTAVAANVMDQYRKATGDETVTVFVSTASPYKFCNHVLTAIGETPAGDGVELLDQLNAASGVTVPRRLAALKGKARRFDLTAEKQEMDNVVLDFLK